MRGDRGDRGVHGVKGVSYSSLKLLLEPPTASQSQATSGGFLDPIEGTLLIAAMGIAIAAPVGVAVAVWMTEYQRPAGLAPAAESGVEMISGAPSVLLAISGWCCSRGRCSLSCRRPRPEGRCPASRSSPRGR